VSGDIGVGGLNRAFAIMQGLIIVNIEILEICMVTKIVIMAITPVAFQ